MVSGRISTDSDLVDMTVRLHKNYITARARCTPYQVWSLVRAESPGLQRECETHVVPYDVDILPSLAPGGITGITYRENVKHIAFEELDTPAPLLEFPLASRCG
jgi:hypothetical protein